MHLANKKSVGLDSVNTFILKLSLPYIVESLTYVYNLCIKTSIFPTVWKSAKVVPIFKPKTFDPTNVANYRPISILPTLSKPLERHIHTHVTKFMENHRLFHPHQSGFRQFHSCHTALTRLCDTWLSAINKREMAGAVFLDLKKAFDLVNHGILCSKLNLYLQNEATTKLLGSFLENRTQKVYVNGDYSKLGHVTCGVAQGSILGPLLFCIFINDLPLYITKKVLCDLFADDGTLHAKAKTVGQLKTKLQANLNTVVQWCLDNKMILNERKTVSMVITTRQKHQRKPLILNLKIGNSKINQVDSHDVLGVTIDKCLRWHLHIDKVCSIVTKNLYLLSKLKPYVGKEARKLFFTAHCLSHMNYASTVWSSADEVHLIRLNSLHRRGAKLIITDTGMSTDEKLKTAGILSLQDQFNLNTTVLVYKVMHSLAPAYLHEFLLKPTERYNSGNLLAPKVRIDLYKTSFSFTGSSAWNSLPSGVRARRTLPSFKSAARRHYVQLP